MQEAIPPQPQKSGSFRPPAELLTGLILLATLAFSYFAISGGYVDQFRIGPWGRAFAIAVLLALSLIPAIWLMVSFGRRLARRRAEKSAIGGEGQMHVQLVGLFSTMAAIPVLVMVIFASIIFQLGIQSWYSAKPRKILNDASKLAQVYYREKQQKVISEAEAMAGDMSYNLSVAPIESPDFVYNFGAQLYRRELSEGAILRITGSGEVQSLALVNPYKRQADNWVPPDVVKQVVAGKATVFKDSGNRLEAVTPIPGQDGLYLYASRVDDSESLDQTRQLSGVLKEYNALQDQARDIQFGFHATLFLLALGIIGVAVAAALRAADQISRPVVALVDAARKVTSGDLSVRVPATGERDEMGTLSTAFNQMTGTLEEQRADLIDANQLAERRRMLIEAVLAGVTAGVVAVNSDMTVRVANESAADLLSIDRAEASGQLIQDLAPVLADVITSGEHEAIIEMTSSVGARTLAVKAVSDNFGHVLTFDDITQQLADQRRAAWSDVARRVAHEIKNPLTPIQLAAERLKRRFAKGQQVDLPTSERLTDTIIRQVGDLRRMVDEFSSFARMPKPMFREESLVDICRQSVFLFEVANPYISFSLEVPDPAPLLVCDRRQLGQAITNIIKNSIEAIEQKEEKSNEDRIDVAILSDEKMVIRVADTGIGLPVERARIVEPYMTTRRTGTGLGLAIVKKIVEEHGGEIKFADSSSGGTIVTLEFDPDELIRLAAAGDATLTGEDAAPRLLTQSRTN